jgi:hypothetical protein
VILKALGGLVVRSEVLVSTQLEVVTAPPHDAQQKLPPRTHVRPMVLRAGQKRSACQAKTPVGDSFGSAFRTQLAQSVCRHLQEHGNLYMLTALAPWGS